MEQSGDTAIAERTLLRDFEIPYPPFPFGSSRNVEARGKENRERFVSYVRGFAGAEAVVECPVKITFRFLLNLTQRVSDLDGLVEPFLNALEGYLYKDDKQVIELHAYRDYVLEGEAKIKIRLETLPDNSKLPKLLKQAEAAKLDPANLEKFAKGVISRSSLRDSGR